ncbi:MAG: ATP-binding protein [Pseudomonadota bacterium]
MRKRLRARFRVSIALQVGLLLVTGALLAWTLLQTNHVAIPVALLLVIGLQVAGLLASVQSHVDTLEEFFAAVNYEDFTRRFIADDLDAELKGEFNLILERFADARSERDVQANYLETVVRHVPVPFFAARADGSLALVNNPARRLTGLPTLAHIDDLAEVDPALPDKLRQIDAGQQQLVQTRLREVPVEWRISVSQIRLDGDVERLYSVENLSGELTARESSAWRNLLRVLTHEIMNTLTPVTSLAETCSDMLQKQNADPDIRDAVGTIARRSGGLMNFVSRYRELMKIPTPRMEELAVLDVVNAAVTLMREQFSETKIAVDVSPESLTVQADRSLLDQVLLNLLRNAVDALAGMKDSRIAIRGRLDHGRVLLQVADNGPGMPDHVLDQVFVPFFTTKREGSGIGLSLSRQIMTAHGGDIAVRSDDNGTVVSLVFG